jgi:transposase InsO family protein
LEGLHGLGHRGVNSLKAQVSRHGLYIRDLHRKTSEVCARCIPCLTGKSVHGGPSRTHVLSSDTPFDVVSIDYVTINDGLKILVMVDHCTSFVDAVPVSEMSGPETMRALKQMLFRWSLPSCLISDNGKSFLYEPLQVWFKSKGIAHRTTPIYSPESNGKCERTIRSLCDSLRIKFLALKSEWISVFDVLLEVLHSLNTSPKEGCDSCPKDLVVTFKERCPLLVTPVPVDKDRKFKGKFSVGQKVLLKTNTPFLDHLDPRFDTTGTVTAHVADYIYEVSREGNESSSPLKYREDRLRAFPDSPHIKVLLV